MNPRHAGTALFEELPLVAGGMFDMQDSKAAAPFVPIIDSIVANRKAAHRFTKVGAMATHGGIRGKQRKDTSDRFDNALSYLDACLLTDVKLNLIKIRARTGRNRVAANHPRGLDF